MNAQVRALNYWDMTSTVLATLPHDALNATIDVFEIPGNYEIGAAM